MRKSSPTPAIVTGFLLTVFAFSPDAAQAAKAPTPVVQPAR